MTSFCVDLLRKASGEKALIRIGGLGENMIPHGEGAEVFTGARIG